MRVTILGHRDVHVFILFPDGAGDEENIFFGCRYHVLNQVREPAIAMGHKKGMLFLWRTISGKESSYFYPSGGAQYHIIRDIAYAIVPYYLIMGDWEYMVSQGVEVLIEPVRVRYDLGHFRERPLN